MKSSIFALVLAALFLMTGCAGYHIGATLPKKMEGIQTLAIPTFHNETLVPRLEAMAASTVVREFQQDGTFQIRTREDADAILEGTIQTIRRRGARSVRSDIVKQQEYNLTVNILYVVKKRCTGAILDQGTIVGTTSFFVSGNDVNQDERQAIPLAIENAATRIVSRISTGW